MAVKVLDRQPGILSNIGNLASLGGMITGQPWLTALGAGAKLTDGLIEKRRKTPSFSYGDISRNMVSV